MNEDKLKIVKLEENVYHDVLYDKLDDYKSIKLRQLLNHKEKLKLVEDNGFDISSKFTQILADIYIHLLNIIIIVFLLGMIGASKIYGVEVFVIMPIAAPIIIFIIFLASENETIDDAHLESEYQAKKIEKRNQRLFKFSKHNKKQINKAVDQYEQYLLNEFNALYIDPNTKQIMYKYDFIKRVNYKHDDKNYTLNMKLEIPDNYIYYYDITDEVDDIDKKALYEVGQKKKIELIDLFKLLQFIHNLNQKEDRIKLIDDSYEELKNQEENVYELNRRIDEYMKINNIDY